MLVIKNFMAFWDKNRYWGKISWELLELPFMINLKGKIHKLLSNVSFIDLS